jgi:3-keto steroid reductase
MDVDVDPGFQVPPSGCDGLTLIMACRSVKRAEAARTQLLSLLDTYVAKLKKQPGYNGHAEVFQQNVVLDIRELDLAIVGSVFKFATGVSQTYVISLLFCILPCFPR